MMRLGVVSDLHYTPDPAPGLAWHGPLDVAGVLGRLADALVWMRDERVDAVAVLGDLTQDGDAGALDTVLAAVAAGWAGPVLCVPGNHDVLEREDALARAVRRHGDARIALAAGEAETLAGVRVGGLASLGTAPTDEPLVLLHHWPLLSRADAFAARGLRYAGDQDNAEALTRLRAREAPTLLINGHLHAADDHRDGRVRQLTVDPLVEAPYAATIVAVTGPELTVEPRTRRL